MKYHGFLLIYSALHIVVAIIYLYLEYWRWNCEMADEKAKESVR